MKKILLSATILCIFAVNLSAGTITGTVKARGRPEAKEDIDAGKYESTKYKFLERINYDELSDFVVYIDQPVAGARSAPVEPVEVVIQKNATFKPHVVPVMVGTTVEWPNHDDIYHNVFSISDPKPFDLGFYKQNEIKRVVFDKPGRVDVFCSIHKKMSCIVLVLTNPFFAATDKNGKYEIRNVPAGTYRLRAWDERLPSQVRDVTVTETGQTVVDFILSVTGLPKY
jgi:plastocyanin